MPGELLGKRSSEIAVSSSRKYCFKLIDEESLKKYDEIFEDLQHFEEEKESDYLINIFRVFLIDCEEKNHKYRDIFLLMPCLRGNVEDIINIYDLKGYTEGRRLNPIEYEDFKFGKDENFVDCKELELIETIDLEKRKKFIEKFIKNVAFLSKHGIIDYSLLISFEQAKPA